MIEHDSCRNGNIKETSLIDVLYFFKGGWKTFIVASAMGLLCSFIYLSFTPKLYEASTHVVMAQMGISNGPLNFLAVNVEEPALLIVRFASPTTFTPNLLEACGYSNHSDANLTLSKSIKLGIVKGVPNVVELRAVSTSPQMARNCADAVFGMIKFTQANIVAPYIEETKAKLVGDEVKLQKIRGLVARIDTSGQAMSAGYFFTRDEIRYLMDEMEVLKNIISISQSRTTQLVSPIYASDFPIAPKKRVVFIIGLLAGFLLGLVIELCRGVNQAEG